MDQIPEMDVSARAGMLLAAFTAGASTQPNLLTRGTRDQALITGMGAVVSYGWGVSSHSFMRSVADRLPFGPVASGVLVDGAAAVAAGAAALALVPAPGQRPAIALARLTALATAATGLAGLAADALELGRGRRGGRTAALTTLAAVGVGSWALTGKGRATVGSDRGDGTYAEDTPREISTPKAAAMGVVTGGLLYGMSHAESALSTGMSRGAAKVLGGSPNDHRTLGRIGATGLSYGAAWMAIAAVTAKLTGAGSEVESANAEQPALPEVTGCPDSGIPWDIQSREGTRWLSGVLLVGHIEAIMGEPAKQPIRVYASLSSGATEEDRADLLMRELDRTHAFDRAAIALFSPTGSGYVNYVANETFEYLARGDCASMALEYSVLPSALSLTKAQAGTRQTRLVVDAITRRLMDLPKDRRPKFFMFGESLGSRVSEDMFTGHSDAGPRGAGIDAAVWVGTPAFTQWRKHLWADRPQGSPPEVGPGSVYLPRDVSDWQDLSEADKAAVNYLLLQNGDDPVPKFEAPLLWRRPDWLGPDDTRPPGAPRGTHWLPVTTFVTTFTDLMNALTPTPGVFQEGGHDYRLEIPEAIQRVWGYEASTAQMQRVNTALRQRELGWELKRDWDSAQEKDSDKRAEAMTKVERQAAEWTGADEPLSPEAVQRIVVDDIQPE
jgi:uncharacterized membrane protein